MSTDDHQNDVPTQPYSMPVDRDRGASAQLVPPIEVGSPSPTGAAQEQPAPVEGINAIAEHTAKLAATLLDAGLTIAVAESLTGGALAAELVRVPGISQSFQGAVVAYQFAVKTKLLGVENDLLAANGAVHPQVALQMASGVRDACATSDRGVDIGVSTTGVAGPEPADGYPAGTVFVGISSLWGERAVQLDFSNLVRDDDPVGSRQRIRQATVEAAVFNVLDHLIERADGK